MNRLLTSLLLCGLFSSPALAYVGPGAGLSAIGAFLALVAGIIIAIFGFFWYPIKRILRNRKNASNGSAE
jgi:hypothetical protein